jgi:formamidopyrimidine-DNA glycosylase
MPHFRLRVPAIAGPGGAGGSCCSIWRRNRHGRGWLLVYRRRARASRTHCVHAGALGIRPPHIGEVPEMPEVEVVRRGLDAAVRGARIQAVTVLWSPFVDATPAIVDTAVIGHRITPIRRRGKMPILDVDDRWHLRVHLKMTGQIVVHRQGQTVVAGGHPTPNILGPMPNTWTRAVFALDGHRTMFVNDQRKFGPIRVVTTAGLAEDPSVSHHGAEPLSEGFTLAQFDAQLVRHRSAPIKAARLDQTTIAGIGNIYADASRPIQRDSGRR